MITVRFDYGSEPVLVKIDGSNLGFSTAESQYRYFSPLEHLKASQEGMLKECPDLVGMELNDMRVIYIYRLKKKLKEMKGEEEIYDYVVSELKKIGYIPITRQKQGFRPEVIK